MDINTTKLTAALDAIESDPESVRFSDLGLLAATLRMVPALPSGSAEIDVKARISAEARRDFILRSYFGI